ncbi:DUF1501 domain-containing protein [Singulisphaera sp. PoT]|uniref:DUF1501 domain-containing protein n=1 Tax=Singulisphaera sp. PoT TaxID=3411797 RepID=UPI003BF5777F
MNLEHEILKAVTRRHFFGNCGVGLGAIALAQLLAKEGRGEAKPETSRSPLAPRPPMLPAKAKSVIYLHMAGSPSQLDLFDEKPALRKFNGKPCPDEYLKGKRFAFIKGVPKMLGTPFSFAQHGQSGASLSEVWKHLPSVIDEFAVVKSVKTDQFNHAPAQLYLQTGTSQFGGASLGSWATYGLGSENQDLPGFVVLTSGGKTPDAGKSVWGSGYLPSVYQGVQCRSPGDPVLFLANPKGMDRNGRRETLDTLRMLNAMESESIGDPETLTRIAQYELAYRMQVAAPEVMDISKEPKSILDLYGARPGFVPDSESADDPRVAYKGTDASLANNCLLARRMVEAGIRFVQIYDWGWDHHGVSPGEHIPTILPIKVQQIDRALTALVLDLKQRGLLDSTLIVWGGEFGRTPMQQNNQPNLPFIGRDHHPFAFTMLLAGGGIKGGQTFGATDDIGYYITENPVDVRDIQATILHLLGLDPWTLSYSYQGLDQRLIGVEGKAKIHKALLA